MELTLKETQLGLRNSKTRIPFRYGNACMTRCPQAVLGVVIESNGGVQAGFSGDCLPPGWFDKSPDKNYRQQLEDMLGVIAVAEAAFRDAFRNLTPFFPAWRTAYDSIHATAATRGWTPLLASFGASLVERAIIDAMSRAAEMSFFRAIKGDLLQLRPAEIHSQLAGFEVAQWLPVEPVRSVFVRHTIGLSDPLTVAEISLDQRLNDGLPQALEEYVARTGIRYFKIKVCNQQDFDLQRLRRIAAIVESAREGDYCVTLDGNEQYHTADEFGSFVEAIQSDASLSQLWENVLCIEQPLERAVALDSAHTNGIRELGVRKPVIIDESDGLLSSYIDAIGLGYRGVSSKSCKGPIKSLINAGLTWLMNDHGRQTDYMMTAEDLCTVGIVPVQQDLCLIATLGLEHVERNGHHFHPGLSYLPKSQQQSALRNHPDLYADHGEFVAPRVVDGRFEIESLQCAGFGFAALPDWRTMQSPQDWTYESLETTT